MKTVQEICSLMVIFTLNERAVLNCKSSKQFEFVSILKLYIFFIDKEHYLWPCIHLNSQLLHVGMGLDDEVYLLTPYIFPCQNLS